MIAAVAGACAVLAGLAVGVTYLISSGSAHHASGKSAATPAGSAGEGASAPAGSGQSFGPAQPTVPSVSGRPAPYFFDNSLSTSIFGRHIMTRAKDVQPFTLQEIFQRAGKYGQPVSASQRLTLQAKDLTSNCAAAVWGAKLQQDLREAGCAQVARGMYVNSDRKYIGMLAVFNLRDNAAVRSVAFAMGPATVKTNPIAKLHPGSDGFVLPLAVSPSGQLGKNQDNVSAAIAEGHFLVIEWSQGPGELSQPEDFTLDGVQNAIDSVTWFIMVRDSNALTAP